MVETRLTPFFFKCNMMPMNLLNKTIILLNNTELKDSQIADFVQVSERWLRYLKAGQAPNASVSHVQAVHDYILKNDPNIIESIAS